MMLVVVQLSTGKKVVMRSNLGMLNPGSGANSIWVTDYSARLYEVTAGVELRPFRNEYYTLVNYQRKYTNMLGPTFGGGSDFKISNSFDKAACHPGHTYGDAKMSRGYFADAERRAQLCGVMAGVSVGVVSVETWIVNQPLPKVLSEDDVSWLAEQVRVPDLAKAKKICYSSNSVDERRHVDFVAACQQRSADEMLLVVAMLSNGKKIVANVGGNSFKALNVAVPEKDTALYEITGKNVYRPRYKNVVSRVTSEYLTFSPQNDLKIYKTLSSGDCYIGNSYGNYSGSPAELQAAERVKFCDEADGAGFGVDVFEAWIVKKPPVALLDEPEVQWLSQALHGGALLNDPKWTRTCFDTETDLGGAGWQQRVKSSDNFVKNKLHVACSELAVHEMLITVAVLDSGRKIAVNTYKQYGRTAAEKQMKPVPAPGADLNVAIFEVTNSSKHYPVGSNGGTRQFWDYTQDKKLSFGQDELFFEKDLTSGHFRRSGSVPTFQSQQTSHLSAPKENFAKAGSDTGYFSVARFAVWVVPKQNHEVLTMDERDWLTGVMRFDKGAIDPENVQTCYDTAQWAAGEANATAFHAACDGQTSATSTLMMVAMLSNGKKIVGKTSLGFDVPNKFGAAAAAGADLGRAQYGAGADTRQHEHRRSLLGSAPAPAPVPVPRRPAPIPSPPPTMFMKDQFVGLYEVTGKRVYDFNGDFERSSHYSTAGAYTRPLFDLT